MEAKNKLSLARVLIGEWRYKVSIYIYVKTRVFRAFLECLAYL